MVCSFDFVANPGYGDLHDGTNLCHAKGTWGLWAFLLASGLSTEQVIEELPDLEVEDVQACLQFAARRLDHPTLAA